MGNGASPPTVSKRFEHTFQLGEHEKLDGSSRISFTMPNFCQLDQVWTRGADAVQVIFELLEFRCAPVITTYLPEGTPVGKEDEANLDLAEDAFAKADELTFTRLSTSEAMIQEKIKTDLLALRNRSVRR